VHDRELEIVRNRAAEYRAWFQTGHLEVLGARIDEQSFQSGDVMFVHVTGPGINYVRFNAPAGQDVPLDELRNLRPEIEGGAVELGGEQWAIASIPVGDGVTL